MQHSRIDIDAVAFDARNDRHQRHFNILEDIQRAGVLLQLWPHRQMELQRDISIFRRIMPGLFQRNLVEGQLVFTFPGDLFEGHSFVLQPALREAVHIMTANNAIEDVGLKHGVEGDTAQFDAVIFQHAAIVFQVLAHFEKLFIFQQRFQQFQRAVARDLIRRIKVVMGNRYIGRHARFDSKGDADQIGTDVIQAVRFRIEGKQRRAFQFADPALQRLFIKDGDVVFSREDSRRDIGLRFYHNRFLRLRGWLASSRLQPFSGFDIRRPALEFVTLKEFHQLFAGRLLNFELFARQLQRNVGFDGRQLVGEVSDLFILLQLRRHGFRTTEAQFGNLLRRGIERVETTQPL